MPEPTPQEIEQSGHDLMMAVAEHRKRFTGRDASTEWQKFLSKKENKWFDKVVGTILLALCALVLFGIGYALYLIF